MSDHNINVQSFIDAHRFSVFQKLVFVLCFFVVLLDGFDTAAIGYIAPSLLNEWGLSKPQLGPVLSAALLGLAAGALMAGPLADKFGRKKILSISVLTFGTCCLMSGFASSLESLTVMRFLTGVGLGAAMPNAVTMMSEYCPTPKRALITNLMFSGFPVGAACGGFLASWMIPQFGWRSVLVLGGITPLILVLLIIFLLPESVRHMVAKHESRERIAAVLGKISASAHEAKSFFMTESKMDAQGKNGLGVVLSKNYLISSLMLWIAYFMGLVIFYGLINWMPILFKEAGVPQEQSTLISALFALGGLGTVFFGWLMDRFNGNTIVSVGFILTAFAIYTIGQSVHSIGWLVFMVIIGGVLMNTSQSSLPALAAGFYPTSGRASGVAWMLGIGRFGGIAGSFLVAYLQAQHMEVANVFAVLSIPALIAAVALFIKQMVNPEGKHANIGLSSVDTH